ncbi:MAG: DUF1152 domain-containing protein [Candidatus Woesearchaeota archaeon]
MQPNKKKVLVIGAGSGRDMASAILITEQIKQSDENVQIDLAGFLTPWALHLFESKLEECINEYIGQETKKLYRDNNNHTKSYEIVDQYFEPILYHINKEKNLGIRKIYGFSLQYGTNQLQKDFDKLVEQNQYDLILAVDVGGDILAHKQDFPTLYTPLVDLTCLQILSNSKTTASKQLVVIAPGVDGEICSKRLAQIIDEEEKNILAEYRIKKNDKNYQQFVALYQEINRKTNSASYTGELLIKAVETGPHQYLKVMFRRKKGKETYIQIQTIDTTLASKIYYFDLEKVKAKRQIEISYHTLQEAQKQMEAMGMAGTELQLGPK